MILAFIRVSWRSTGRHALEPRGMHRQDLSQTANDGNETPPTTHNPATPQTEPRRILHCRPAFRLPPGLRLHSCISPLQADGCADHLVRWHDSTKKSATQNSRPSASMRPLAEPSSLSFSRQCMSVPRKVSILPWKSHDFPWLCFCSGWKLIYMTRRKP